MAQLSEAIPETGFDGTETRINGSPMSVVVSMHKVTGIGGFFFKAQDYDLLPRWYRDNLGIDAVAPEEGSSVELE